MIQHNRPQVVRVHMEFAGRIQAACTMLQRRNMEKIHTGFTFYLMLNYYFIALAQHHLLIILDQI